MSNSLQPYELQHARPPCPSPTPGVHSDSRPSSQWCHPAISSAVVPFSSCPQSLPASESFPLSQFLSWGGQSIGVFSFSITPSKEHPGLISFRMDWLDLLEEMQIKTAMRYITSRLPWWPSSKRTQTANIRMDVEKREPSHTVSGNINWCSHCEKQYGGFFVFVFFF